ncbi:tyrosine/serine/threonine protein phosphatase pps1, partial [Cryomyces antarcticus]
MSKASEISKNVWLGPTPDPAIDTIDTTTTEDSKFDVLIETSDLAQVPDSRTYRAVERILNEGKQPPQMEFPSSGSIMPPTWSQAEVDGLMATCSWIYRMANPDRRKDSGFAEKDKDGDSIMVSTTPKARKTLIHCTDGYTETSLLGLAYF